VKPQITVTRISIPPLSTVGYGWGVDENGREVHFAGDHRPLRDIGEALEAGAEVVVDLEQWQVLRVGRLN